MDCPIPPAVPNFPALPHLLLDAAQWQLKTWSSKFRQDVYNLDFLSNLAAATVSCFRGQICLDKLVWSKHLSATRPNQVQIKQCLNQAKGNTFRIPNSHRCNNCKIMPTLSYSRFKFCRHKWIIRNKQAGVRTSLQKVPMIVVWQVKWLGLDWQTALW